MDLTTDPEDTVSIASIDEICMRNVHPEFIQWQANPRRNLWHTTLSSIRRLLIGFRKASLYYVEMVIVTCTGQTARTAAACAQGIAGHHPLLTYQPQ